MEKPEKFIATEKLLEDIDERVLKLARLLKEEGYVFDLRIANENEISLKVGGKEITFTKIDPYTIKKDGMVYSKSIDRVIEDRIKELATIRKE